MLEIIVFCAATGATICKSHGTELFCNVGGKLGEISGLEYQVLSFFNIRGTVNCIESI
jgi:hypothetical protein